MTDRVDKEQALGVLASIVAHRGQIDILRRFIEQSNPAELRCEGCGKTMEAHDYLLHCGNTATQANVEFSGRVTEVRHEHSTLLVRYEGLPPPVGANVLFTGLPVAYQYHYPDGALRVNFGEAVNGLRPDASRPLYAPLRSEPLT